MNKTFRHVGSVPYQSKVPIKELGENWNENLKSRLITAKRVRRLKNRLLTTPSSSRVPIDVRYNNVN